jgi:hypothetical protein
MQYTEPMGFWPTKCGTKQAKSAARAVGDFDNPIS